MNIGQEQLMRLKGKREHLAPASTPPPDSVFWRIIYNAYYLWLAVVLALCVLIAVCG